MFYMQFGSNANVLDTRVVVAAACVLPADSLFAILLYLIYPESFLPSALFIINFSLVLIALLGINSKVSSMILPALIWKCVLLLFLLFLGCISVDAYQQVPADLDHPIPEPQFNRSMTIWKELAGKYPMLPFVAVACAIVLAIEARIFFTAWQKMCCPAHVGDESDLEKSPPSYASCVRDSSSAKDLPTYEDALRKSISTPSTSAPNSSSSQMPHHVIIYTIPDVKPQKFPVVFNL